MPRWDYDDWDFPVSVPRAVEGGIKARSKRGAFVATWWGQRWIALLESFDLGARLARGRSYARRGQVIGLDIESGKVTAKVQGSRATPYKVAIEIAPIADADWQGFCRMLAENIALAARLMAGEMPPAIEEAFAEAGLSLFPRRAAELATSCSCPDWSNPCKHIAAVYYLLAEEFDRDPFLMFRLRGMPRDDFVHRLGEATVLPGANPSRDDASAERAPLAMEPAAFWQGAPVAEGIFGEVQAPDAAAPLARRLGGFPFWRGDEDFLAAMERSYRQAAERALRAYLGDGSDAAPG